MTQLMDDPRITSAEETGYAPWMQNWHEDEDEADEDISDTEMQNLKEVLEFYARYYPEETVFIGSANTFFCIGKPGELIYKAEATGKKYLAMYEQSVRRNETLAQKYPDGITGRKVRRTIENAKGRIERFVPFLEREVTDVYPRITGGTAIIVTGDENGWYWTEEEAKSRC